MTDEVQQTQDEQAPDVAPTDQVAPEIGHEPEAPASEVAPHSDTPAVDEDAPTAENGGLTAPQPAAAAEPEVPAVAESGVQAAAGEDPVAQHVSMLAKVETRLREFEAFIEKGLHVPLDEWRALRQRVTDHLNSFDH